jgi:hypothetical protein
MSEQPQRFPPPHPKTTRNADGTVSPVMEPVVIECGQRARLGGVLVECIRRVGHPVRINYGHSNGYTEWAFDAPADN